MYPAHADWREAIEIAENVDPHVLDILTPHYMSPMPNTYTFTKSLAEHVVHDLCDGYIPSVIFRPSIGNFLDFKGAKINQIKYVKICNLNLFYKCRLFSMFFKYNMYIMQVYHIYKILSQSQSSILVCCIPFL